MPTVSVYVKNEDWEKWRALQKPSEFIHNALNRAVLEHVAGIKETGLTEKMLDDTLKSLEDKGIKPIKTPKGIKIPGSNTVLVPEYIKLCKHGYDPKLCKFAKPGKPCK